MIEGMTPPNDIRQELEYRPDTGDFFWVTGNRGRKAGSKAGFVHSSGYVRVRHRGIVYLGHRLAWWFTHDEMPEVVDHINRNTADNRLANLRNVTHSLNALNTGKTGVKWVRTSRGQYKAYATYRMKHLYRGNSIYTAHFKRIMAERADHPIALPSPYA
jgi:hypothetical protein